MGPGSWVRLSDGDALYDPFALSAKRIEGIRGVRNDPLTSNVTFAHHMMQVLFSAFTDCDESAGNLLEPAVGPKGDALVVTIPSRPPAAQSQVGAHEGFDVRRIGPVGNRLDYVVYLAEREMGIGNHVAIV